LTVNYVASMESFKHRSQVCDDFGFQCKCKLCETDRNDSSLEKREAAIESLKGKLVSEDEETLVEEGDLVESIRETYRKSGQERDEELKVDLIQPMMLQAEFYLKIDDLDKSAREYLKIYETFKNVDEYASLYSLFEAAKTYKLNSKAEDMEKCLKLAREYFIGHSDYFDHICRCRLG
jgi:hypothetical protein